jgi:hypothetical protein
VLSAIKTDHRGRRYHKWRGRKKSAEKPFFAKNGAFHAKIGAFYAKNGAFHAKIGAFGPNPSSRNCFFSPILKFKADFLILFISPLQIINQSRFDASSKKYLMP